MNNFIQNTIWEKRLPPFSGLVLVAVLLVTISWMTGNVILFSTRAATGAQPKNMQITNITDTSFTVTYQTDDPIIGSVGYGTNDTLGNIGLDDRDQVTHKATEHRIHHITITNLTPASTYLFDISSGGTVYKNDGALYEITTAPTITAQLTTPQPLRGQVTKDDGSIPIEGIVYLSTGTSQTVTAMLLPDGSYEVPVDKLRTKDLRAWEKVVPETELAMTVLDPTQQTSATVLAGQANPAPRMVLSKNYDFSLPSSLAADAEATESAASPVDLPIPVDESQVTSPIITIPKEEQSFTDPQPTFTGKALPNTEVIITVQSEQPVEATVQADGNGNWEFSPTLPLAAGKHTITIKAPDAQGILQSISQSFTVYAEGSQFIEPSVSPPPVLTPVLVSPGASSSPSLSPSSLPLPPTIATPTISPAVVITNMPEPTSSAVISPQTTTRPSNPPVPNSGSSTLLISFVGVLLTAGVGTLLFFFL